MMLMMPPAPSASCFIEGSVMTSIFLICEAGILRITSLKFLNIADDRPLTSTLKSLCPLSFTLPSASMVSCGTLRRISSSVGRFLGVGRDERFLDGDRHLVDVHALPQADRTGIGRGSAERDGLRFGIVAHHGDLQAVIARGLRREFEPPLRIGGDGGDGRRIAQQGRRGEAHGGVVRCVDDLAAQQEFLLCGHAQRQERQQQEKRSFFHLSGVGTDALRCAGEVSCKVFCRLLSTNISILFRKSNTPPRSVRIIGKIAIFVV